MPRLRRRIRPRREYTSGERNQLLTGEPAMLGRGFGMPRRCNINIRAAEEAWLHLRDELLPRFITEHPGRRPWAWWAFDSLVLRRRIGGGTHPHDHPDWPSACPKEFWFGLPSPYRWLPDGEHFHPHEKHPAYESEADYLRRLKLLTPDEELSVSAKGEQCHD